MPGFGKVGLGLSVGRGGAVASPAPSDVTDLITALGGNAVVPGFYDVRSGITASGGFVDRWADARGGGFGPALTGTTTSRPAWDSVNLLVTSDGTDDRLMAAASSLFPLNAATSLIYVGSIPTNAGGSTRYVAAINDNGAFGRFFQIGSGASSAGITVTTPSGPSTAASLAPSATRRVIIAGQSASTSCTIDVPNGTAGTLTTAAQSSGNNALWLFGDRSASPDNCIASVARAAFVLARKATAGDITTIKTWAVTNHSAVLT